MLEFGMFKATLDEALSRTIAKKENNTKLLKEYVSLLKKDNLLKRQYEIYYMIETANIKTIDLIEPTLNEVADSLRSVDQQKIWESNFQLSELLKKHNYTIMENYENKDLHDKIYEYTVYYHPFINERAEKRNNSKLFINKYLTETIENRKDNTDESYYPPKLLEKTLMDLFEAKYGAKLSQTELKFLKNRMNNDMVGNNEVFTQLVKECTGKVNEQLKGNIDLNQKEKLLETKERLLMMEFNQFDYENDIIKLNNLKNYLFNS